MPVINLGPFGRFEFTRQTTPAEPLLPVHKDSSVIDVDDQPPPYTALPTAPSAITNPLESQLHQHHDLTNRKTADEVEWTSSTRAEKPACRVRQLRRYLIEIVALTLGADFDQLNVALYNDKDITGTNSILSAIERDELFALSCLVKRVHDTHVNKLAINEQDRQHILNTITHPADDIDGWGLRSCVMDLIAWYGEPLTRPIPWAETVPNYFRIHHASSGSYIGELPLSSMRGLGSFIPRIAMKEEVGNVLVQAFEACCQREGYGEVVPGDQYTPIRFKYSDLYFEVFYSRRVLLQEKVCQKWYGSKWGDCVCGKKAPLDEAAHAVMSEEQFQAELLKIATAGDALEVITRASSLLGRLSRR
ncbi:hypothetical protein HBH70_082170 [Parastagonospora nodorum]|nr:hypothetical protein HBI09_160000 [Parastagonospora nodorum]KAH4069499.1 hypothetical protein HBH50_099830 [Parastagonospora nodorum]KAH4089908.1 hypothetical protein HBH48_103610 [Parastagonospora nodorum]KAH4125142.1 hypothetical protein HBH47_065730 [Parastagonospora nodorum]KAH4173993.1 hypothetical protein HBH43_085830 [Parastagonospora nodorum]